MKALVLDAAQRSALAVTRSLGCEGLAVTTADAAARSLAGESRHSQRYLQSPSPEHEPQAYLSWMADLLAREQFDFVVPVTEITSQLLLMHENRFSGLNLPFCDYTTVMSVADKGRLMAQAAELGVTHPATRWYRSAEELGGATIEYPVVLKPCLSRIFTGEKWVSTRVKVLDSRAALEKELAASPYLWEHPFMLQAFIPGKGAGIFCLYDRGKPAAFFAHRRLREKPPEGGVSVLSESAPVDETMKAQAETLLSHAQWHGVAMVEFRVSPEGEAYLMEVNTRFWGSLQLAIDSGVNFPALLWRIQQSKPVPDTSGYRVGQRLRWLLGDVDSLYLYLKGRYTIGEKARRVLQFLTPRFRASRHEVNRLDDLGPARHEMTLYLKQLVGRET